MITIQELPIVDVIPGFHGRFIHTEHSTLGFWEIDKGSVLPIHSHMHEQVTEVRLGEFELTIAGETKIYTPGMIAVIPPNVQHSGTALTDCKLLDIFLPVREDYKAL
ncbi:MAG: cupin domain-containing protein [Pedobacter sp.]|nr:MAG: cupin domain-containing protein [Pedobacter sp.]